MPLGLARLTSTIRGSGPGSASPDATGKAYAVSGLKPGSSAALYGNGTQIATATVDSAGKATWTLASAPAAGTIITYDGVVVGSGGTVPAAAVMPPVAPTLNGLSVPATSFTAGAAAGTVIGAITGKTAGSTLSISPNDGRLAFNGDQSALVVGLTASSAGSANYAVIETLDGATNSPRSNPVTIAVSAAATGQAYDLNFASQTYQTPTGSVADPVASGLLSINRASALTVPDSTGKFSTFAAGQIARNDLGLWRRGQTRTNQIPNSVLGGGTAGTGTGYTLPTGLTQPSLPQAGLARTVSYGAADPDKGLAYMDIRYQGTPTTGGQHQIMLCPVQTMTVTPNEFRCFSAYIGMPQGGYVYDATTRVVLQALWYNSAGTQIGTSACPDKMLIRDTVPRRQKWVALAPANAAFCSLSLQVVVKASVAYDFTVRTMQPQCEAVSALTQDASLPILTSSGAVTANADTITLAGAALTYLQGGAGTVEMTTTELRGSGLDWRADNVPLLTFNGNVRALKRMWDARIASELAGAPTTYKGWRSMLGWGQTHAISWDNTGARVASTVQQQATAKALGSVPAITSVSLDQDGCLPRLVLRNAVSDLATYNQIQADVIHYGATSGGVVGAAASIRDGSSARLIGGWREVMPGGMATGGLSAVDASDITVFSGMSRDYVSYCNELTGKGTLNVLVVVPKDALLYFDYLVRKYRINMHWSKGVVPSSLVKSPTTKRISSFGTTLGQTVSAGLQYVDHSYEGDLAAAAGVAFTVGREAKTTANPFNGNQGLRPAQTDSVGLAGHNFLPTPNGSYTTILNVDPFLTPGNAASGLVSGVTHTAPGTLDAADGQIQAYNFRLTMTQDATIRAGATPFIVQGSPPPGYTAAKYELLGRYMAALAAAGYTAVPYGTTPGANQFNLSLFMLLNGGVYQDINSQCGFSTDAFGYNWGPGWASIMTAAGVTSPSADYAVASYAEREIYWKWHENFIRGLFYFMAYSGDTRVPAQITSDVLTFGLANDHYLDPHENDERNWNSQLYVREARRIIGLLILNHTDITATDGTAPRSTNSIGCGSYGIDSHSGKRFADTSTGTPRTICEGNIFNPVGGNKYFPLVAEYITPTANDCTNLTVTFAASAAHTGFGALRMEPAHMASAEAAGIMGSQLAKQGASAPNMQDHIASNYASTIRPALLAVGINAPQVN